MRPQRAVTESCTGKVRFDSAKLAHEVAAKRPRGNRTAYRCIHCGGWHLGSQKRNAKRLRRVSYEGHP